MYSIFEELLKERGLTVADVCRATGIRQSTMSNWKKRNNNLTPKNAKLVADFFGVSVDYLYGVNSISYSHDIQREMLFEAQLKLDGWTVTHTNPAKDKPCDKCVRTSDSWIDGEEDNRKQLCPECLLNKGKCIISNGDESFTFSEDEYRSLLRANQLDTLRQIVKNPPDIPQRIPVVRRVAAGIPLDSIEEFIGWEELSPRLSNHGTYFGLQIKGDSMEPGIRDGDVVIVREQPDAEDGEIVVALVNGNDGVCKRLKKYADGTIALMSDNAAYLPMYFNNSEIDNVPVQIKGVVRELRRKF